MLSGIFNGINNGIHAIGTSLTSFVKYSSGAIHQSLTYLAHGGETPIPFKRVTFGAIEAPIEVSTQFGTIVLFGTINRLSSVLRKLIQERKPITFNLPETLKAVLKNEKNAPPYAIRCMLEDFPSLDIDESILEQCYDVIALRLQKVRLALDLRYLPDVLEILFLIKKEITFDIHEKLKNVLEELKPFYKDTIDRPFFRQFSSIKYVIDTLYRLPIEESIREQCCSTIAAYTHKHFISFRGKDLLGVLSCGLRILSQAKQTIDSGTHQQLLSAIKNNQHQSNFGPYLLEALASSQIDQSILEQYHSAIVSDIHKTLSALNHYQDITICTVRLIEDFQSFQSVLIQLSIDESIRKQCSTKIASFLNKGSHFSSIRSLSKGLQMLLDLDQEIKFTISEAIIASLDLDQKIKESVADILKILQHKIAENFDSSLFYQALDVIDLYSPSATADFLSTLSTENMTVSGWEQIKAILIDPEFLQRRLTTLNQLTSIFNALNTIAKGAKGVIERATDLRTSTALQ